MDCLTNCAVTAPGGARATIFFGNRYERRYQRRWRAAEGLSRRYPRRNSVDRQFSCHLANRPAQWAGGRRPRASHTLQRLCRGGGPLSRHIHPPSAESFAIASGELASLLARRRREREWPHGWGGGLDPSGMSGDDGVLDNAITAANAGKLVVAGYFQPPTQQPRRHTDTGGRAYCRRPAAGVLPVRRRPTSRHGRGSEFQIGVNEVRLRRSPPRMAGQHPAFCPRYGSRIRGGESLSCRHHFFQPGPGKVSRRSDRSGESRNRFARHNCFIRFHG
jgi:hypothetical protein